MKIYTSIFLVLFVLSAFGQSATKAKSILDKVSEQTKAYPSITADFDFTMENTEVDLMESNSGSLIVQGDQYKLTISGIEMYSDGESQWTYMPDAQEVSIVEAGMGDEGSINPATIFTIYENGFDYIYLGEFTSDGQETHKIELIPTEEKEFTRVILEIDQSNYQIKNASMFGVDGNIYGISVKNMKTDKKYAVATFKFFPADHPDVSVIDMR